MEEENNLDPYPTPVPLKGGLIKTDSLAMTPTTMKYIQPKSPL